MVVSSKASSWRQPRPRSKRVKLLAARKGNSSSRHFWGRPEKHEHARDGVGEVAPISAHYFRFLYGTSRNAVTPCPTKDIQIHETTHPGLGRRALPIPIDESSFCLGKRVRATGRKFHWHGTGKNVSADNDLFYSSANYSAATRIERKRSTLNFSAAFAERTDLPF